MYCKKCGNQIDEGAAFCKKCGTPAEKAPGVAAAGTGKGFAQVDARYLKTGIVIASLLMALATALPYMVFSKEFSHLVGARSFSMLNAGKVAGNGGMGDGIIFIILAVMMLVFLYLKKNTPVLVCGIIPFLMYCYEVAQIKKQNEYLFGRQNIDMYDYMSKGAGFYLLTVSVAALLMLSVLFFLKNRNAGKQV